MSKSKWPIVLVFLLAALFLVFAVFTPSHLGRIDTPLPKEAQPCTPSHPCPHAE